MDILHVHVNKNKQTKQNYYMWMLKVTTDYNLPWNLEGKQSIERFFSLSHTVSHFLTRA